MAHDGPPRAGRCPACGGALVEGSMAVAVLGAPRFVVRIGTTEVATEVDATLCGECGLVQLHGRDPAAVRTARQAAGLGRTPVRWPWRTRPAPPYPAPPTAARGDDAAGRA